MNINTLLKKKIDNNYGNTIVLRKNSPFVLGAFNVKKIIDYFLKNNKINGIEKILGSDNEEYLLLKSSNELLLIQADVCNDVDISSLVYNDYIKNRDIYFNNASNINNYEIYLSSSFSYKEEEINNNRVLHINLKSEKMFLKK